MLHPPARPIATAAMPTDSDGRAPHRMRLSMSRPVWSVPSQCAGPGGSSLSARCTAIGSCGASHGARAASSTTAPTSTAPTKPAGVFSSLASAPGRRTVSLTPRSAG